jgi:hypothetical protein
MGWLIEVRPLCIAGILGLAAGACRAQPRPAAEDFAANGVRADQIVDGAAIQVSASVRERLLTVVVTARPAGRDSAVIDYAGGCPLRVVLADDSRVRWESDRAERGAECVLVTRHAVVTLAAALVLTSEIDLRRAIGDSLADVPLRVRVIFARVPHEVQFELGRLPSRGQ